MTLSYNIDLDFKIFVKNFDRNSLNGFKTDSAWPTI